MNATWCVLGCTVLIVYLEWDCGMAEMRGSFGGKDGEVGSEL